MKQNRILILDDDRIVCKSLKLLFSKTGYEVEAIYNPLNIIDFIKSFSPDLLLLDMNFTVTTTGNQGIKVLKDVRAHFSELPVILITGWGTLELAVRGMRLGGSDFITKPWNNEYILKSVETILSIQHLKNKEKETSNALDAIIGESQEVINIKKIITQVAATDATVLITGESGTGKELVAEALHDQSLRSEEPFVKVNLGGIPDALFESELFGHKKGAFTGALNDREGRFQKANNGTIFLDEIGDLKHPSQVKLLRVLQEGTFEPLGSSTAVKTNVRVISATHRNLREKINTGTFREDLFYRINLLQIKLPSLKDRRSDIPLLIRSFMSQLQDNNQEKDKFIKDSTLEWLSNQTYSGNIRQLKNIIERTWLLSTKPELVINDFKPHFESNMGKEKYMPKVDSMTLDEMEKSMIVRAIAFHNGNISQAAKGLGITRSSLYRRLEKHGISPEIS